MLGKLLTPEEAVALGMPDTVANALCLSKEQVERLRTAVHDAKRRISDADTLSKDKNSLPVRPR